MVRLLISTIRMNLQSIKLFTVAPQTSKVIAIGHKCLVQMEKALNVYNKTFRERHCIHVTYYSVLLQLFCFIIGYSLIVFIYLIIIYYYC